MKPRHFTKRPCSNCGALVWTSSSRELFNCSPCRRELGYKSARNSDGYTSLSSIKAPVMSDGVCKQCGCESERLADGICENCKFYSMSDIDPVLSANARRGPGGEFDWVRQRRPH